MKEQEELFSKNHHRLLSIATWANFLAWVALVIHILWAVGTYFLEQNYFLTYRILGNQVPYQEFVDYLQQVPSYGFSVLIEIVGVFLRGIVYFLVLKGISLGLNMIVETDINYREQRGDVV